MKKGLGNATAARIAVAARRLIEGDAADVDERRPSRTVFTANRSNDEVIEDCIFGAALDGGLGAVSIRFGRDADATPGRANLTFLHESVPLRVRNCVLWSEDEGPVLLMPFDAREDHHFAVGPSGIERRVGRPAEMLGRGMARAKARLGRTARALLRSKEFGPTFTVLTPGHAA